MMQCDIVLGCNSLKFKRLDINFMLSKLSPDIIVCVYSPLDRYMKKLGIASKI